LLTIQELVKISFTKFQHKYTKHAFSIHTKIEYCLKKCLLLQRKIRVGDLDHLREECFFSGRSNTKKQIIHTHQLLR
jgi:hypothetical protein